MNYETVLLKTNRLVMKMGTKEDYLRVYEYDFNKLKNIDGECKLEKQDLSKIDAWFKGGMKRYYTKIKKAHMFDWIIYHNNEIATTKMINQDEHGVGIKNIIRIVEKYNGEYVIQNDEDQFYFSIIIPL